MSRESARFYIAGITVGTAGTVAGRLLGWEGTALFLAGMGPVFLVMLIFMLREPREGHPGASVRGSTRRRA